jgi:hypothetical protein
MGRGIDALCSGIVQDVAGGGLAGGSAAESEVSGFGFEFVFGVWFIQWLGGGGAFNSLCFRGRNIIHFRVHARGLLLGGALGWVRRASTVIALGCVRHAI